MSAYETLGAADALLVGSRTSFAYPEFATVVGLLSDGSSSLNAVIQSGAPTLRRATRTWVGAESDVVALVSGYAEDKDAHPLTEQDGTTRSVVVMDFHADEGAAALWSIQVTLLEVSDPVPAGSGS